MGQCSTLPSEGRTASSSRRGGDENVSHRNKDRSKKNSFLQVHTHNNNGGSVSTGNGGSSQHHSAAEFSPIQNNHQQQHHHHHGQQGRNPDVMSDSGGPEPMDTDEPVREDIPQPPEIAVRTRCYKLNLDSNMFPLPNMFLGPFADAPPPLTYSDSSDASENATPLQVAIQTAKIFRGITVAKDGTILSQNARATRSNRGSNKTKRGEKSRQATKIEKAKDLVEETILTGKAPDSDEDANMQSLVIMGEYDDMKYLVRDGSKKLREATELPEDSLLAINRLRDYMMVAEKSVSSPRKRGSSGHHRSSSSSGTPKRQSGYGDSSTSGNSQLPKLKSHPRDRPSSRSNKDDRHRRSDTSPSSSQHHHHPIESDARGENWGNTLPVHFSRGFHSIWNCGATGGEDASSGRATSPTQVVTSPRHEGKSQHSHHSSSHHGMSVTGSGMPIATSAHGGNGSKPVFEGRETHYGQTREGGVTTRAN